MIDPPLPLIDKFKGRADAQKLLAEGITSLPPGRTLTWELGPGFNLLKNDGPQPHAFVIDADGPFGHIPRVTYTVDLADWSGQVAWAPGNLRLVAKAIDDLAKKIN